MLLLQAAEERLGNIENLVLLMAPATLEITTEADIPQRLVWPNCRLPPFTGPDLE